MKRIRPALWLIALATLLIVGTWIGGVAWRDEPSQPKDSEKLAASPARGPGSEEAPPANPAATVPPAHSAAAEEPEASKPIARQQPGPKRVPWRQGKKRSGGSEEDRKQAISRLLELGYKPWEAEELRQAWDGEMGAVDAELDRLGQLQPDRSLYMDRRLLEQAAYENLNEILEEDDYVAARYSADKVTQLSLYHVTPDSPAAGQSLHAGDQIYSYDGIRLYDLDQYGALRSAEADPTRIVVLEIIRDGQSFFVEVPGGFLGSPISGTITPP